jgi:hypothetical protein
MDPHSLGGKVPALELYDLQHDPDEMKNLAADPAVRPELMRLYGALRAWAQETADPGVQLPDSPPSSQE